MSQLSTAKFLLVLILFRLLNAFNLRTFLDPDEFWQAPEIAHRFVFEFGHVSWEWQQEMKGFAYPALLSLIYKALAWCRLDETDLIVWAPMAIHAVSTAFTDYFTYKLAQKYFGGKVATWTLFCSLSSFFFAFAGPRTYSTSIETTFTALGLWLWPASAIVGSYDPEQHTSSFKMTLLVAGISCLLRPTNAVIWMYMGLISLLRNKSHTWHLIQTAGMMATFMVLSSVYIDSIYYEKPIFVPWNFLKFSVTEIIASFHDTHPWHWYIAQGFPLVAAAHLPFVLIGMAQIPKTESDVKKNKYLSSVHNAFVGVFVWSIACYSALQNKSSRFIMPLVPLMCLFGGLALSRMSLPFTSKTQGESKEKPEVKSELKLKPQKQPWSFKLRLSITLILFVNGAMFFVFSRLHQRGVIDVMWYLRRQHQLGEHAKTPLKNVFFMMPCHSTPFHSFLHAKDVEMDFLKCGPPVGIPADQRESYSTEQIVFYQDPVEFMTSKFPHISDDAQGEVPSHIVMFQHLEWVMEEDPFKERYQKCARFFNSFWYSDEERKGDVLVYCRQ